jgi:glutamate carboxypeptidase
MKSGDLSILYSLRALQEQGFNGFGQVTVVHNSDEEVGSPSSRDLIRERAEEADAVLVLEAGRENGNVVSSRKGVVDFRLHVRGQSAHAGVNHARGRSAALELAHLVVALEGLNGTIPGATLNVGRIEAGERPNVVPDYAFAHFEARAFELSHLHQMIDAVQRVSEQRTVSDTSADLEISIDHLPMPPSEGSAHLLRLAQSLARQLGFSVEGVATGGASDGNTAAAAGRPVLDGLGPVGGQAHSPHEYLDVPSIVPRTALLAGLIATLGSGPNL